MGPRSDNRGYVTVAAADELRKATLQWVHGLITVVMKGLPHRAAWAHQLQWVHGLITVVMAPTGHNQEHAAGLQWVHGLITVVMVVTAHCTGNPFKLQWVHGLITVVMIPIGGLYNLAHRASMGPRSDNRGYGPAKRPGTPATSAASMGPRSDNRGYAPLHPPKFWQSMRFNGSTV